MSTGRCRQSDELWGVGILRIFFPALSLPNFYGSGWTPRLCEMSHMRWKKPWEVTSAGVTCRRASGVLGPRSWTPPLFDSLRDEVGTPHCRAAWWTWASAGLRFLHGQATKWHQLWCCGGPGNQFPLFLFPPLFSRFPRLPGRTVWKRKPSVKLNKWKESLDAIKINVWHISISDAHITHTSCGSCRILRRLYNQAGNLEKLERKHCDVHIACAHAHTETDTV